MRRLRVFAIGAGAALLAACGGHEAVCDSACQEAAAEQAAYEASPEAAAHREIRARFLAYEAKLTDTYGAAYTWCMQPRRWADYEREDGSAHRRCVWQTDQGRARQACLDKLPVYTPTTAARHNEARQACDANSPLPAPIPEVLRAPPPSF